MSTLRLSGLLLAAALILPTLSSAEDDMTQISLSDQSRWDYFSDQVMGGISQGQASFEQSGDQTVLRLTGKVSTANNGGFIQARTKLDAPLPATAQGIILNVKGNDQTYYVHIRTTWTLLPWQFYQASFEMSEDWQEVRIPFGDFAPYGRMLRKTFDAQTMQSIAVVAFGRDHDADLSVRAIGMY
ncbi:MAG: CIA30 family protein [Rhodobacteraceae bacterium]|nr:CIA30 family protein [Paracoccaceae bacterium]